MPSSVSCHNPAHSVQSFLSHLLAIMLLLTAGMGNAVLAGSATRGGGELKLPGR